MNKNEIVKQGYEDTKLLNYNDAFDFLTSVAYKDLGEKSVSGVLKCNRIINGELKQIYSERDTHILTNAATRMGKTTSCVIPLIASFARQKVKRSMVVSDPKGELYRLLSNFLKNEGYEVLLLNLRDYKHSELWNPLTPIFRKFRRAQKICGEVEVVETENGVRNKFNGVVYEKQSALDEALSQMKYLLLADVDKEIDEFMFTVIPRDEAKDQYWNEASRQWGKANLWAMLEDSVPKNGKAKITEDTFSFNTLFTILDSLTDQENYDDGGYFSSRDDDSRAYVYSKSITSTPNGTRQCIVSCFNAKMQAYKNSTIRLVTACSSFEMSRFTSGRPVAFFIAYPDETKVYYQIISSFVQNAYNYLIDYANKKPSGSLDVPFYFILDEFGNFPQIADFDTVISACGGRNIWFDLVLQSYAQLDNVYGQKTAEIIRDNLNLHIFLGSNNPVTLSEFSKECGEITRISPRSALNGNSAEIEHYDIETIPLIPKSTLTKLKAGECIITEANCGYVFFSKMERYYLCNELSNFIRSSENDYTSEINPLDKKYLYTFEKSKNNLFDDFDF